MLHLNATELATAAPDAIFLYNFATHSTSRLELTNTPAGFPGVFVHAIEVFESPSTPSADGSKMDSGLLTIFINSHRPIAGQDGSQGAGSVIEIFETRLGESALKWVKTIEHEVVRTPNSMAAISPRQVYFSNDHRRKNHWVSLSRIPYLCCRLGPKLTAEMLNQSRLLEAAYAEPSDLGFCDASGPGEAKCIVAAEGPVFPNGMVADPNGLIYSASSLAGDIRVWEQQADYTLAMIDQIKVRPPRLLVLSSGF